MPHLVWCKSTLYSDSELARQLQREGDLRDSVLLSRDEGHKEEKWKKQQSKSHKQLQPLITLHDTSKVNLIVSN